MKLEKKVLTRSASVILAATLLAGCGQTASGSKASGDGSKTEEPMEITFVSWNCGEIVEDNWAEQKIEEALNIELHTKVVDLSQTQQRDLMLASGEFPDCGWVLREPRELVEQGVLRTIPREMIEKYAPNYAALMDSDPQGWVINKMGDTDEYAALSGYKAGNGDSMAFMSCYRYDWLQKLGIEPNGEVIQMDEEGKIFLATEPFTQSQFEEIIQKFTTEDPDGNGKDDTFGIAASKMDNFFWNSLFSPYSIMELGSVEQNGEAEYYYVTDAYKQLLKDYAQYYANGYIDREFATLDRTKAWEKVGTGKAGYCLTIADWVGSNRATFATRPPHNMVSAGGTALVVPTEVADDGTGGSRAYGQSNISLQQNFMINANVDDEKLAKILEFFDYVNFNPEMMVALRYGEEGVHFEYTSEDKKSVPEIKSGVTLGGETGLMVYNANYIQTADFYNDVVASEYEKRMRDFTSSEEAKAKVLQPYRVDLGGTTQLTALEAKYNPSLTVLVEEYFYKSICGEVDIDATWDEYVKQLNDAGYAEIHDELQKAPLYSEFTGE